LGRENVAKLPKRQMCPQFYPTGLSPKTGFLRENQYWASEVHNSLLVRARIDSPLKISSPGFFPQPGDFNKILLSTGRLFFANCNHNTLGFRPYFLQVNHLMAFLSYVAYETTSAACMVSVCIALPLSHILSQAVTDSSEIHMSKNRNQL
jgi:hypothetical protein